MHSALAVNPSVAAYLITVQVASHLGNYVLGTRHSFWDNEMFPEMHPAALNSSVPTPVRHPMPPMPLPPTLSRRVPNSIGAPVRLPRAWYSLGGELGRARKPYEFLRRRA